MELECKVQNYEWGKLGSDSMVAQLLSNGNPNVTIDPDKPYAELWMGTHPNGPSLIVERGILLSEYLSHNHDAIGPDVNRKFGITVPFLLKVLSIRKPLSIQAHPAKKHAEELHRLFPDMYKDSNHKPELAIALTPFEALCGFRPVTQIKKFLQDLPELAQILPEKTLGEYLNSEGSENSEKELKSVFHSLMTCDKQNITLSLQSLLSRLEKEDSSIQTSLLYPLVQKLHRDFPGDVGCWAPYFMNYLKLAPGQAIFLKPNLPHAYICGAIKISLASTVKENIVRKPARLRVLHNVLKGVSANPHMASVVDYGQILLILRGDPCSVESREWVDHDWLFTLNRNELFADCVECMACSDNVVRAGLTPKHIDVLTLIDMLDYKSYTNDEMLFNPQLEDENSCIWRPPVPDFAVVRIKVQSGDSYNTKMRPSPSVIIITSGTGQACDTEPVQARPGVVLFLKASRQLTLTPAEGSHIEAYQAICNV